MDLESAINVYTLYNKNRGVDTFLVKTFQTLFDHPMLLLQHIMCT